MKLKYRFVVREIDNIPVAIAVGEDNERFNGMIKLNSTGAFIFEKLFNDVTAEEIVDAMLEKYDVDREIAENNVNDFVAVLRDKQLLEE